MKIIGLYILVTLSCVQLAFCQQIYDVNAVNNDDLAYFFEKTEEEINLTQVLSDTSVQWKTISNSNLSFFIFHQKMWFKAKFYSNKEIEKLFSLNYVLIPYGKIYVSSSISDDLKEYDISTTVTKGKTDNAIPLYFKEGETKELYLEINGYGGALSTFAKLYDTTEYKQLSTTRDKVFLIIRTLSILLALGMLVLGFITKDKAYFGVLLYSLGFSLFSEIESGNFLGLLDFRGADFSYLLRIIVNQVGVYGLSQYFKYSLTDKKDKEVLPYILHVNILLIALYIVSFFYPYNFWINTLTTVGVILYCWWYANLILLNMIIPALKEKKPFSKITLSLYIFIMVTFFLFVAVPHFGIMKRSFYTNVISYFNAVLISAFIIYILIMKWLDTIKNYQKLQNIEKEHQLKHIQTIVDSQENERNRIGRDIHDRIGGNLSFMKMKNQDNDIQPILDNTLSNVRELSHNLVTPNLEKEYFLDELQELALKMSTSSTHYTFTHHIDGKIDTSETNFHHIYRIIQEMYTVLPIISKATRVDLEISREKEKLLISYLDNSTLKFASTEDIDREIQNVKYRIQILSGIHKINTKRGIAILIQIPL
ncbi:sensor histidine kinase [Flammeovirga kamogawensis]|uniref:Signal transduction histidine kinase subgroup 3 dimerisation and phosphoacceptor domain-containing protein n=1 Tax=Flammeovirga kamogawensis TaxID=373891 RepID=A0ABX8GQ22_9BACT|nr:histidine kinase [Flammeovirga kamogawensis]MBB6463057.1 signal transduction histidine kinase [Flammeovirga kamogawensis]QWG05694.1 hypothetical protein KM029_09890 [Flammeovirga kamogawensis]TRX67522.1 hypothetical protein EO216_04920 [Flammeovirga kamogawensis]